MQSRVLLIDDSPDIHDLVEVRLRPENVELRHALNARSAWDELGGQPTDLILLDLDLEESELSGLELCRQFSNDPTVAAVPVIFLTGTGDPKIKAQALDAGAVDYVTKPFDAVELRARVRAALRTKRYHDLLATRAQLDGLTGLWNRAYLDDRLERELSAAQRHDRELSLILMDIDRFKRLNDTYGHPFGDEVLRLVAQAITESLRKDDVACRYGGEEFAIVLRETRRSTAQDVAERLRSALEQLPCAHQGEVVRVTASFGVAARVRSSKETAPGHLIQTADEALYAAKEGGRNRVH